MENLISYLALFLSIFLLTKLVFSGNKNSPPAPFSLPLIGHLYLFRKPLRSLPQTLHQLSLKHGPIFSLQLGCRSFLVLSSPLAVEECFTKHDIIFANRPKTLAGDYLTYDYTSPTWAPYGELWRSLRRLGTIEIFSQKSLKKFSAIREQEVCSFVRQIFKVSNKGSQKVDSQYLFSLLMWNIITRVVAGKQCIEEETAITDLGMQYLKEIKDKFFPSISLPMGACDFLPILRWVGYKGLEKTIVAVHRKRDGFCQGLIEEIRQKKTKSLNNHTTKLKFGERTNLIETLLSLQESEPENYSENIIKSIISTIFIAGTESSANTMVWATSLLLNHPEVLKKVRAEIEHHVGHERLLKDADLPKLPYLQFVIKETLRLYPPAPLLLPRSSSEECIVGGFQIPKDTVLVVNAWAIHSDPNVWEEPDRFKPDRFEALLMDGERDRVEFKFIPFGVGRRACPGAAMAIRTVCLAMGTLIQCFDLERDGKELGDMSTGLGRTFKMNEPLNAVFTARRVMADVLSEL